MFEFVCETLRETAALGILPAHLLKQPLTPEMSLMDLGIDSLGSMTFLSEIAGRLSISVPDFDLDQNLTLREITDALNDIKPFHAG